MNIKPYIINEVIYKNNGNGFKKVFRNQLNEKDKHYYTSYELENILYNKYNITLEEYYQLIMPNDKRKKCKVCKNYYAFDRRFMKWYNTCQTCKMTKITHDAIENGTHNFLGKNLTKELRQKHKKDMQSFEFRCIALCESSKAKAEKCKYTLYISDIDDKYIHLGITKDITKRQIDGKCYFDNLKALCEGSSDDIIDLELAIKLKYADRKSYELNRKTEVFFRKDKRNIIRFINKYIEQSSTTIPTGSTLKRVEVVDATK